MTTVPGLAQLSPRTLRDLAAAIEARTPAARARDTLSPEGVDRLADILIQGTTPTIGFYRRYAPAGPGCDARPAPDPAPAPTPEVPPLAPVMERTDAGPVREIEGVW